MRLLMGSLVCAAPSPLPLRCMFALCPLLASIDDLQDYVERMLVFKKAVESLKQVGSWVMLSPLDGGDSRQAS